MTWILLLVIVSFNGQTIETRMEITAATEAECVRFGGEVAKKVVAADPARIIAVGIGCSEKTPGQDI